MLMTIKVKTARREALNYSPGPGSPCSGTVARKQERAGKLSVHPTRMMPPLQWLPYPVNVADVTEVFPVGDWWLTKVNNFRLFQFAV